LGEHFVTLFYAVYDPATGRFAYVSAGHETQILRRATGGVIQLKATGPILGITDYDYEQSVEYLEPFDTVILFTDGLTEARNGRHELLEIDRVVDLVGDIPSDAGSAAVASTLVGAAMNWAGGRPQDDLALMVVQRDERSRFSEISPMTATPVDRLVQGELLFDFTFPSLPDYAAEVRQAVAHWMGTLMFGRLEIEDFQTAVTESVTNAVRYGSPMGENDRFSVRGYRREDGALMVEVRDYGPGMKIPAMPILMPAPTANGGRGLPLMAALSDEVEFLPVKDGFRVRLIKRLPGG
jgi:anti-sigma regulatory factor (Ser/Thr protein kinase)